MKSLARSRKVRDLAIRHLAITEQQKATNKIVKKDLSVKEQARMRAFMTNCQRTHGIGRSGALELLMKVSTFVAITEKERDPEGDPR